MSSKKKIFIVLSAEDMAKADRAAKRQAEIEAGCDNTGHRIYKNKKSYNRTEKHRKQVFNF